MSLTASKIIPPVLPWVSASMAKSITPLCRAGNSRVWLPLTSSALG